VLTSPSCSERDLLVKRFLETGAKKGEVAFYVTINPGIAKALADEYPLSFWLFVCNPQADAIAKDAPNIVKLKGVENLNDISMALTSAIRKLDPSQKGARRICLDLVSDVLLQHHTVQTRRWMAGLIPELKSAGFTTLGVMDSRIHPSEELYAILGLFDGEISIFEKEGEKGGGKYLKINKMSNQRYLEDELPMRREEPEAKPQESTIGQAVLDKHRIAVLPFVSISPDPSDEYFADGLTEELIGRLSLLGGLEVIARTSVMTYKKKEKTVAQIGRELRAGALLEGSVRKAGNRIRVTAQLIDANTEGHMWMENYDRSLEDIFAVQTDVAEKVARSLQVRVTALDRKKMTKGGTSDMEAYTLYLKGLFHVWHYTEKELSTAIEYFGQALAKDGKYALAYCGLALAYSWLGWLDMMSNKAAAEKAKQYAARALELDDSLSDAHAVLAFAHLDEYDLVGSEREAKKAVELNPSYAATRLVLASIYHYTGRRDESIRETEKSFELDPLSLNTSLLGGSLFLYTGLYDEAIRHLKNALELEPGNAICLDNIGLAHIQKGLVQEGLEEIEKARKMQGGGFSASLAYAYVRAGKLAEAKKILVELQDREKTGKVHLATLAGVYAVLGDKEKALGLLERAYDEHSGSILTMGADFWFASLRDEPRFQVLLKKMGLKAVERPPD
jgi:TolB-like protein/Tfp pilus assembly protein PilF